MKPSVIAKHFDVSRPTMHRQLSRLVEAGLIQRVGEGPTAHYKTFALIETTATATPTTIRMELGEKTVNLLRQTLEWRARLGIGQLQVFAELLRHGDIQWAGEHGESKPIWLDNTTIDEASGVCDLLKRECLGLSSNASLGIHHAMVKDRAKMAWEFCAALRHRMAWDRSPEGFKGVWHDEPTKLESDHALPSVFSIEFKDRRKKEIGIEADFVHRFQIEASSAFWDVAEEALRDHVRAISGDVGVLADLMEAGSIPRGDGTPMNAHQIAVARAQCAHLTAVIRSKPIQHSEAPALAEELLACLSSEDAGDACSQVDSLQQGSGNTERRFSKGERVRRIQSMHEALEASIQALPEDLAIVRKGHLYMVLQDTAGNDKNGPDPALLRVVGESHSVQTAIQLANIRLSPDANRSNRSNRSSAMMPSASVF